MEDFFIFFFQICLDKLEFFLLFVGLRIVKLYQRFMVIDTTTTVSQYVLQCSSTFRNCVIRWCTVIFGIHNVQLNAVLD